jgi:glycosyl transferase family 2
MTCCDLPSPIRGLHMTVVVPARNEADGIAAALHALCKQVDKRGLPLDPKSYEILVLANNCDDGTAQIAHEVGSCYPQHHVHVCEVTFPPGHANIGHARRWLMDLAAERLGGFAHPRRIIASTDADTVATPDWLASISTEIAAGVDAVGGRIIMGHPGDGTDPALRRYHLNDVAFLHLITELETRLDPLGHDPWPRHHQHFGANLATTVGAYLRVGGLPHVTTLEDMAYFDALRRADARVRHSPHVRVRTSSRRDGRVAIGLSTQLGEWADALDRGEIPPVEAASAAEARFLERRAWREWWHGVRSEPPPVATGTDWAVIAQQFATFGAFYDRTQAGRPPCALEPVSDAITALRQLLTELRVLPSLPLLGHSFQEIEPVLLGARATQVA